MRAARIRHQVKGVRKIFFGLIFADFYYVKRKK